MPFGAVTLIPGVNVERTPTLNQAGISAGQLIRFKDSLVQKYGGWQKFFPRAIAGLPRDLHVWQDLNTVNHLSVGTTTNLGVITAGVYQDITPQELTTNFALNFSTVINTNAVTIVDTNVSGVTVYDSVTFLTPVSVGGIILSGTYQIQVITGADSYKIFAATNATGNVTGGGAVPVFTTTNASSLVNVALAAHGRSVGDKINFPIPTSGNGVTISGTYAVTAVPDANDITITASTQATGNGSFTMNSGNCRLVYDIALGPPSLASGYGTGGYGSGGYGIGTTTSAQTGTPITATDYTSDNWGQILLACPAGGGVYQWDPTGGFSNAQLVATAPRYNAGIFVSTSLQILVCYGSTVTEQIGIQQDPLEVQWSTEGDYTNFVPLSTDTAGSFRIPTGSVIRAGLAALNQNLIWTDLSLWSMTYIGGQLVFGFEEIGAGAGTVSSHAVQALRGNIYWMGLSNFYSLTGNGVESMPCPVWDAVFQNLNKPFQANVRAMPNSSFNEVGWLYPSLSSSNGECDSYVKVNITEPGSPWDYGSLQRSAWVGRNIIGEPISATQGGIIYLQETSSNADGQPLVWSFTTGYFYIAEGEDFAFVDQIYPDFKWGTFTNPGTAQVQITINVVMYPDSTPITYGPYTVSQGSGYLPVRFRGSLMQFVIGGNDLFSFVRLGKVRYRYATDGRR